MSHRGRPPLRRLQQLGRLLRRGGVLLGVAAMSSASTPEAWKSFDEEVIKACLGASQLSQARPAGARVDFDDQLGYSALLISGRYPQPHLHGHPGRELCLFDRRTRRAVVSSADGLMAPRKAPSAPPAR